MSERTNTSSPALYIRLGRAGRLWPEAARLTKQARDANVRALLLVPRQYTLQTERALLDALQIEGFFDIDVLSPTRFSQRVFADAGGDDRTRVDARGKAMAVEGALLQAKDELVYYERAAQRQGFVTAIGTLIANLKSALITPDLLFEYAQSLEQGAKRDKLTDLSIIYRAYEGLLAGRFVDGEDVQTMLLDRLKDAALLRGARLIIYGFDVVTGDMARLAIEASKYAESVHFLLIADPSDPAFAPVTDSVRRFEKLMKKEDVPYDAAFIRAPLDAPEDIRALEVGLLRPRCAQYTGAVSAVRLYDAPTPYAEAHFVAQEILLNNKRGVPFSDMRVLACDEARYFSVLDAVLESYHIPHYLSQKAPAQNLGAAAFVLCALRAAASGYRAQEMCAALRTGYLPLSSEERFEMENYIAAFGIRGRMFLAPFTRGGERGALLEDARKRMMEPLEAFRTALKSASDTDAALLAVMALLDDVGAYQKHLSDVKALSDAGLPARAMQLSQVWDTLMRLLDQMHELLGGARVTGAQAAAWLEAGLEQSELSSLPQTAGSVTCGLVGNVALARARVLFVMGLNDGVLNAPEGGLIAEDEQRDLEKALDAHLTLDADGREQLALLDIYKAFACAGERLYLSNAQALQDGTALRPLYLLRSVKRLLPALVEEGGVTAPQGAKLPLALSPALDGLGARLRSGEMDEAWTSAWRYVSQARPDEARALLRAFVPRSPAAPLPTDVADQLFLERVSSVSRLETYAACPFKHFVRYGLRPREKEEWSLEKREAGTFYHNALEGFTRLLPNVQGWPNVSREVCDETIERAADGAMSDVLRQIMGDSGRALATGKRYVRLLKRVAWTFTKTAQASSFRPKRAEVRFGFEDSGLPPIALTLDDGRRVLLRGQIDRVDRYEGDEGVFLRVVDYKSGAQALSPRQIFYGAQLQLLLYLMAALQDDGEAQPAGAFYFHIADPLLPDPGEKEQIEEKLAQALSLNGVTLRDAQIIRLLDSGEPPLSMPKLLTKSGDFMKNKPLATLEEMRLLIDHALRCARALAQGIADGRIDVSPLEIANECSPCERCGYAAICRKDAPDSHMSPRPGENMTFDELLQKLKEGG